MQPKEILFIARNYPPNVGGMEILNFELYQNLKKKIPLSIYKNKGNIYSLSFLAKGLMKAFFSKERIIFLSDALLSIYIPFLKLKGKKVIIKIHGLDITYPNFFYQKIVPRLANLSDKIICISNFVKDECLERNIAPDKILVINPGIYPNKYFSSNLKNKSLLTNLLKFKSNIESKSILLSIGRLTRRKGTFWFIKNVFVKLPNNFIYIVAGNGPENKKIKNLIKNKKINNRVFVLGAIDETKKKILLNASDLFIMPNIKVNGDMEGFGIAAIEAASCGLPVVASNLEGIKDAIKHNKNGFLVKPYDVKNYIKLIRKLIINVVRGKEFGKKAREFTLENYTWDKITQKYLDVFENNY